MSLSPFYFMITLKELNKNNYPLTKEMEDNLNTLLTRMNVIRLAYNAPMIITSGVRSLSDQMRINPSAPKSNHLIAAACDVLDIDGKLHLWCKQNEQFLLKTGLWLEERQGNWQHFQVKPYKSYKPEKSIWFKP